MISHCGLFYLNMRVLCIYRDYRPIDIIIAAITDLDRRSVLLKILCIACQIIRCIGNIYQA